MAGGHTVESRAQTLGAGASGAAARAVPGQVAASVATSGGTEGVAFVECAACSGEEAAAGFIGVVGAAPEATGGAGRAMGGAGRATGGAGRAMGDGGRASMARRTGCRTKSGGVTA